MIKKIIGYLLILLGFLIPNFALSIYLQIPLIQIFFADISCIFLVIFLLLTVGLGMKLLEE